MPAGGKTTGRARLARLWKDWGLFAILIVLIVGGGTVALVVRQSGGRQQDISQVTPYRIYFTQAKATEPATAGVETAILGDINAAKRSVEVATPGLDLPSLASSLIAAKGRGLTVRVLEDAATQEDPAVLTVTEGLRQAGVEVVLRAADGALGGAFVVLDESLVWAGAWDLSQQGLNVDDGLVLRWEIPQLAQDFHDEFTEMFGDRAYGPASPANTRHKYLAFPPPVSASISVYMTPEDDPIGEVLQSLAKVQREIIVVTGGLEDQRLEDRLIAESAKKTVETWAILGDLGSSEQGVASLIANEAALLKYRGRGELRQSFILVDGEVACFFSQAMKKDWLDRNDGYVIVLRDRNIGSLLQQELARLVQAVQSSP
jgi:hypothetical protein